MHEDIHFSLMTYGLVVLKGPKALKLSPYNIFQVLPGDSWYPGNLPVVTNSKELRFCS